MSGNIRTITIKINKACDELDFTEARRLIEANLTKLSEAKHYRLLDENAKTLIKHVIADNDKDDSDKLTRTELLTINNINMYCTNFDISMLKRTLRNSIELLQRPAVLPLLNNDARIILDNMGAVLGARQFQQ